MRDAIRDRIIRPGVTILDYGCGRGDDVRILRALGYEAVGWDPQYYPVPSPQRAQIVNFGYVLNVIESPIERAAALRLAHQLATEVLVVSAYVHNGSATKTKVCKPCGDGHLTARGHFQKLFYHKELGNYIESCLGKNPESADFGVFYLRKNSGGTEGRMDDAVLGGGREALLAEFAASHERPLGRLLRREMSERQQKMLSVHFDSYDHLCAEAASLLADEVTTAKGYRSVGFGKRTRDALYLHRSAVEHLPLSLKLLVARALQVITDLGNPPTWEVAKISSDLQNLSFLNTEPFEVSDYPALLDSTRVSLRDRSVRYIRESANNPSIYHRKELFLHPSHPQFQVFQRLSERDERAGLLSRKDIGRRLQWAKIQASCHFGK